MEAGASITLGNSEETGAPLGAAMSSSHRIRVENRKPEGLLAQPGTC